MKSCQRIVGAVPEVLAARTRDQIAEDLGGVGFSDLYRRLKPLPKKGNIHLSKWEDKLRIPGAVLPDDLREDVGTDLWQVMLSGYMLRKQKTKHGELDKRVYLNNQRILDDGRIYHQSDTQRIGLWQDEDGQWWKNAWKKTQSGKELLFSSLHKVGSDELAKIERMRGKPIERRKK